MKSLNSLILSLVIGAGLFLRPAYGIAQIKVDGGPVLSPADQRLSEEIALYDNDSDQTLKCLDAIALFRKEYELNPTNADAALYFGRSYDHAASIGGYCPINDSTFFMYADSALKYFHIAEKLRPGIQDRKFGFAVPVMIGHLFGARCLWQLKHGNYEKAKRELSDGFAERGFSPAQLEICRMMLDLCDSGSIFFPAGDDDTFPTMCLQMVEGYRTDVSVVNLSLASMPWYLKLFLSGPKNGFAGVPTTLTSKEVDSLESIEIKQTIPDRLYTDVDSKTRKRIHNELGIDIADKAELCFPVYEKYGDSFYTYGASKAIASILIANKWKRHVFFGIGGIEAYLKCTGVPFRSCGILDELYPITNEQAEHFKKDGIWLNEKKVKKILENGLRMEKFSAEQTPTNAEIMYYQTFSLVLGSLSHTDPSAHELIKKIQMIPHHLLPKGEDHILSTAFLMHQFGYFSEASKESQDLVPIYEKKVSSERTSFGREESNYIIALLLTGNCAKAKEFVNTFSISEEAKESAFKQFKAEYGCE